MNAFVNDSLASSKMSTSKIEFLEKFNMLPPEVRAGLDAGTLKLVDHVLYSTKLLGGSTSKELMEASDDKKEGITNVNGRKMEALQYFCVKGIRLSGAVVSGSDAITEATIANQKFGKLSDGVMNGELEILVSGKTAFPRNSCGAFSADENGYNGLSSYYELDCPFMIAPQSEIVPTLRVNSNVVTTREVVRIELIGTKIIPA